MPALSGNLIDDRAALRNGVETLSGFVAYGLYGYLALSTATAAAFALVDADGNALSIPASASDPAYVHYCSFNLPAGVVADAANRVLKLSSAATVAAGANSAVSSVSGASPFAYAAEACRAPSVPGTVVALTANTPFNLYSTDGANAAAGTFGSASGLVYIDVEIIYLKRKLAIAAGQSMRSRSDAYKAAGVAAGFI